MIELRDITFAYSKQAPLFDSFCWKIEQGESWAVLGSSGGGKTTLLRLIAGLCRPAAGQIIIAGERIERPRPRTGLIQQDFGLLPWATIRENASLGLKVRGFYGPDGRHAPRDEIIESIKERVDPWLERMGLLSQADKYPAQVSGGQRQRAAIARALVLNPNVMLMDEPFASLDAPTREELQKLVLELGFEQGLTTVLVTHAIEEAAFMGQKILILGQLPHRDPIVIDNPHTPDPVFRNSAAYAHICRQLRQKMDALR